MGLCLFILLMAAFSGIAVPAGSTSEPAAAPMDSRGGSSQRVVLVEKFTADWCYYCTPMAHSLDRFATEYGHDKLVVLEYHPSSSDELFNTDSQTRGLFYSFDGYPSAIINGGGPYSGDTSNPGQGGLTLWLVGAWDGEKFSRYSNFDNLVNQELAPQNSANLTIEIDAELTGNQGTVKATVTATDMIMDNDLTVQLVIYQNNNFHWDANTNENTGWYHRIYNHLVRMVLPEAIIPPTFDMGQTFEVERAFTLNPSWYAGLDVRDVGVAVFVQKATRTSFLDTTGPVDTKYNAAVLQAAAVDFTEPYVLLVNDDSTDNLDEGMNRYQAALTKGGIPYKVWDSQELADSNVNSVRSRPTAADMAPYPLVIWFTGSDQVALEPMERLSIETYMNAGGNLFIVGEDIGQHAGMTGYLLWFQQYLHASYSGNDNVPASAVDGVPGDPISDGLLGLAIDTNSPSEITPMPMADPVFTYTGGALVGAVRASHGTSSRVVYMAFNYFEGTDTSDGDDTEVLLMQRVLDWMDGAAPPTVDVIQPDGGESLANGAMYEIRWDARDVDLPQMPIDISYTSDYDQPVPTWTPIATSQPNDGVFRWNVPMGVNSAYCRVRVVATDSQTLTGEAMSNADFTIGTPPVPFQVLLNPGMNMVSFPKVVGDTTLTTVLATIDPDYATVRAYDPTAAGDPWLGWARGKATNDLADLDHTMGFWIDVTAPAPITLTIDGTDPTTTDIPLTAGWNLVGFPSASTTYTVADLKVDTGATRVEGFSPSAGPYYLQVLAGGYVLSAGEAYWVYVPGNTLWSVAF